jgi:large subunit ribosomal protein L3
MNVSLWGVKKGMTQFPTKEGKYIPVTVILITPNIIAQVRTEKTNDSTIVIIQSSFKECKTKDLNKAQLGHLKKNNVLTYKHLKETRIKAKGEPDAQEVISKFPIGSSLDISLFKKKDKVKVIGISKGKGFAGVIKRHGFALQNMAHGGGPVHRSMGSSAGGRGTRQKVPKGKKMPGRMGSQQVSVRNLEIIEILPVENTKSQVILVKGAVPGNKGGLVNLCKSI